MRGKFTTRTIIIAIIALLVLAVAVTGTVIFLKDSGEASAAGEAQNVAGYEQSTQKDEQQNKDENQKEDINIENVEDQNNEAVEGSSNETNNERNEENESSTNQNDNNNNNNQEEPAPTTVEREKVISETTTLGWNNIGFNSGVNANSFEINYNNLEYKVEYYFEGVLEEDSIVIVGENSKGKIIETYEDKVKIGYKLDKVENLPLTITENEEENVIKVSYVKDESQTKDLSYTVKYFIDNVEQVDDKVERTETVWVNAEETMNFDDTLLEKEYTGYEKVGTNPEIVGETVNNGDIIEVYYIAITDLKYTVEHYTENLDGTWKKVDADEISNVKYGTYAIYEANTYEGFTFDDSLTENKGATVPANNDLVIKLYYTRNTYSYAVEHYTENLDGTWNIGDTDIVENATFGTAAEYDLNEYSGFTNNPELTVNGDRTVPANNELVIKLYYTRNTYSYTVEHYTENLDGTWKLEDSEPIEDVQYGAAAEYDLNEYSGFINNPELTVNGDMTVPANNELVIKLYYTRNTYSYTVEHYTENLDGTWKLENSEPVKNVKYGTAAAYTAKTYTGFTFDSTRTVNGNSTVPANNELVIKLYYTRNSYSYKVEHYTEISQGEWYKETTDFIRDAKYGAPATYTAKTYTGFSFDDKLTVNKEATVPANNSLVIKLYYKRDNYSYTVEHYKENLNGGFSIVQGDTQTITGVKYGTAATYTAKTYTGFAFDSTRTVNGNRTVPANNDLVIKLYYTRDTYSYTVEHYKENLNGGFSIVQGDTQTITGVKYGATATYTAKTYTGFSFDDKLTVNKEATVPANNSLVIKLYYKRDNYSYTVEHYKENLNGGFSIVQGDTQTITGVKYGATATYTAKTYTGFSFDDKLTVNKEATVPANNDLVIKLYYTRNNYTYKVNYYYNGEQVSSVPTEKYNAKYGEKVCYTDDMDKSDENGGDWTLDSEKTDEQLIVGTVESENVLNIYYVKAIITIDKSANKSTANVKENIIYTITLINSGGLAGIRTVTDTLPEGVTFISTTDGVYNSKTRTVTWENIEVLANSEVELDVTVRVNKDQLGATITNQANVISSNEKDSCTTKINTVTCNTQEIEKGEEAKDNVNVVLVLDISTSMNTTDRGNSKSRLELAKDAMKAFVNTLWANNTTNADATISLIVFNKTASIKQVNGKNVSGIFDKTELLSTISSIQTSTMGTDMWDGLDEAQSLITSTLKTTSPYSNNSNVIIFLGDGKPMNGSTAGNNSSGIITKASTIKGNSVGAEIYTIGFGTEAAKFSNDEDSAYYILKNMASTPSSEYFKTAVTGAELAGIFTNIADSVSEKTGTVTGGLITITIGAGKTLLVDGTHPLIVKSGSTELIKITTKPLPSYFDTSESGKIKFNANAYNLVAEEGKEVINGKIDIIYYVE